MSTGAVIPEKPSSNRGTFKTLIDAVIDALAVFDGILGTTMGEVLPNGSLDTYVTGATTPASWVRTLLQNGAGAAETTDPFHGSKAYKFTRVSGASNGGGQLTSANFLPVGGGAQVNFSCLYKASAALQSTVELLFYDEAESPVETRTVCTITEQTLWRGLSYVGYAPATARFVKIRITGGTTAVDVAGNAWFDGLMFASETNVPTLSGAEYTTNETDYFTVETLHIPIPADATTLTITCLVKSGGGGPYVYFRAKTSNTTGSEHNTSSSGWVSKTSTLTLATADKGQTVDLELQIYTTDAGVAAGLLAESDISGGFEANISIT